MYPASPHPADCIAGSPQLSATRYTPRHQKQQDSALSCNVTVGPSAGGGALPETADGAPVVAPNGTAEVAVRVVDGSGKPVQGAQVRALALAAAAPAVITSLSGCATKNSHAHGCF